ncbi:MAG: hypothetical protein LCH39_05260 [Proteobacteria bacterium]|nr:hypothetical protein [Pseudomonadota bacterium]
MAMPISTTLFLACMQVLRWLFFAVAALFVLLAIRAYFDPNITLGMNKALLSAGVFVLTGIVTGLLRAAVVRRLRRS